ncbi:hypothetical protein [Nannocystis punicea]|uniref:Lipoprotein n=1 Tax=Nannocystis punicea TaxID=2995304 RepID=A0ABY7HCZ0_9BACT|nr:hypothetical protein [Nannocystis poenicansa]WAS97137.1 hypothetical protein O0S08_13395 [Nannocystis poenicansa]
MNQRSVIALFLALVAGAGCAKNSEEALTRAQEAATKHCDCVQEQMKKPWSEVREADCAVTQAAFYEAVKLDHSDPKAEKIYNLGRGCITKLREMDQRATAAK